MENEIKLKLLTTNRFIPDIHTYPLHPPFFGCCDQTYFHSNALPVAPSDQSAVPRFQETFAASPGQVIPRSLISSKPPGWTAPWNNFCQPFLAKLEMTWWFKSLACRSWSSKSERRPTKSNKYAESSWVKQENCGKLWTSGTKHQFSFNKTVCFSGFRSRWCWRNLDLDQAQVPCCHPESERCLRGRILDGKQTPILSGKSDSSGRHWSDDSDIFRIIQM